MREIIGMMSQRYAVLIQAALENRYCNATPCPTFKVRCVSSISSMFAVDGEGHLSADELNGWRCYAQGYRDSLRAHSTF